MIEPADGLERYILAGVEPERLRQFRMGVLDLRALLTDRSEKEWFLASPTGGPDAPLSLQPQTSSLMNAPFLPDAGFLLHDRPASAHALSEARARNNLVLEIAMEPPEAALEHRMRASTLAGLLSHLQSIVKYAYGAALQEIDPGDRRHIDKSDSHLLDVVVPASAGSFRVVLEAAKLPDLLGENELARGMKRIDALFAAAASPQATLDIVKKHPGHFAGAYLRLLRFLVQSKSGLRYAWAEPRFSEPVQRGMSEAEASPLIEVLSAVANLGAETVDLTGALKKADVGSGAWRLATEEGEISGKTKEGGPSLAGLKLEGQYRFTCLEEIEESYGGGREQHTFYLTKHEPT